MLKPVCAVAYLLGPTMIYGVRDCAGNSVMSNNMEGSLYVHYTREQQTADTDELVCLQNNEYQAICTRVRKHLGRLRCCGLCFSVAGTAAYTALSLADGQYAAASDIAMASIGVGVGLLLATIKARRMLPEAVYFVPASQNEAYLYESA